uniref:Rab-GAP TBC domain-containing protein n=1 Tax=Guillardia theta TaxID=55529 RepID=A0A7S4HA87_GUITH|mmetsp:Transcript_12007/g.41640  ORF Transcript_12007/g.41640 Transcript_12007/m.41640 type:complete len:401 (+) Transcript_12007:289-1491(+)
MASEIVQWIAVGGKRKEVKGKNRARHAMKLVNILNLPHEEMQESLRKAAVTDGFLSPAFRRKIWPRLLRVEVDDSWTSSSLVKRDHREKKQVELDVVRSMLYTDMRKRTREHRLAELSTVIDTILATNPDLHYYQGFNDVCSVAILVMGSDSTALPVAERLAKYHFREAMNKSMFAVQQALHLLMNIIKRRDRKLYECLSECEVDPIFALSWILTWFAHDLKSLDKIERLYDFFLASHPLMSLYFSASLLCWQRQQLLPSKGDYSMIHSVMQTLPSDLPLEQLIHDAHRMFQTIPPDSVLAGASLECQRVFTSQSMWIAYPYRFADDTRAVQEQRPSTWKLVRRFVRGSWPLSSMHMLSSLWTRGSLAAAVAIVVKQLPWIIRSLSKEEAGWGGHTVGVL